MNSAEMNSADSADSEEMNAAEKNVVTRSLSAADRQLIADTADASLAKLDQDQLHTLLERVRKARDKHQSMYRRQASKRVPQQGGRGAASEKNQGNVDRLDVFAEALERVTEALAAVEAANGEDDAASKELRDARIEAGRLVSANPMASLPGADPFPTGPVSQKGAMSRDSALKTPQQKKIVASTRAQTSRNQAKRDSR